MNYVPILMGGMICLLIFILIKARQEAIKAGLGVKK